MNDIKILFVDNLEDLCEYYQRYFTKKGLKVFTALSPEKGLEVYQTEKPHIVISDLRMDSVMTGVDLLRKIRQVDQHCACYIITGTHADYCKLDEIREINAGCFFKPKLPSEIYEELLPVIEKIKSGLP